MMRYALPMGISSNPGAPRKVSRDFVVRGVNLGTGSVIRASLAPAGGGWGAQIYIYIYIFENKFSGAHN